MAELSQNQMVRELESRFINLKEDSRSRAERRKVASRVWLDAGAMSEYRVRLEFIRFCRSVGFDGQTLPKLFRLPDDQRLGVPRGDKSVHEPLLIRKRVNRTVAVVGTKQIDQVVERGRTIPPSAVRVTDSE